MSAGLASFVSYNSGRISGRVVSHDVSFYNNHIMYYCIHQDRLSDYYTFEAMNCAPAFASIW